MPYIKKEDRARLLEQKMYTVAPETAGELNFLITTLCHHYLIQKGLKYTTFNAIIGTLQCAMMKFYRRLIGNYEDDKIKENGDVF